MTSGFGVEETKKHGKIAFFQESEGCVKGKEHDWSGWRNHYDYCEHDGPHNKDCCPSGGEAFCINCGMGAIHHSLMFDGEPEVPAPNPKPTKVFQGL